MRSPHTSYRWRGERVIEPIKCMRSPQTSYRWREERVIESIKCMRSPHTSYRWRGERVIESIKCMRSPHTSYRWRGERVIESIKWMRIIRRLWLIRASGGNFGQDTRVTHLLFTRSAMGFLMTTESQDLGLMSHPKDVFNIWSANSTFYYTFKLIFTRASMPAFINWLFHNKMFHFFY